MTPCADGSSFISLVIVMRKDAVYTVLLNATLFKGMKCSYAPQDQRYLRFSTFDRAGVPTHYNLRVGVALAFALCTISADWYLCSSYRSSLMQGSPVNCWTRSTRISPKWSRARPLMAISPLYFSLIFLLFFLSVLGPQQMYLHKIWMSSRMIRNHVDQ